MIEILVNHGDRRKLMRLFAASYPTVQSALRGRTNTLRAQRIRAAALKMGGAEKRRTPGAETNGAKND
jgi:hypothetical protein